MAYFWKTSPSLPWSPNTLTAPKINRTSCCKCFFNQEESPSLWWNKCSSAPYQIANLPLKESACLLLSSTPLLPPGALHVGPLLVRLRHDSEGWAMPWMKADYQAHAGILIMHKTACLNNLSSFPSPI